MTRWNTRRNMFAVRFAALAAMAFSGTPASYAAGNTGYWVGGDSGLPTDWATANNWTDGTSVLGAAPAAGDTVLLQGTASLFSIDGTGAAASISLNGATGYTVNAALGIDAGGTISVETTNGAAHILNGSISFGGGTGAGSIINNDSAHTLSIPNTASTLSVSTLTLGGAGPISIASPLSLAATGGLTVNSGVVTAPVVSGNITVGAGTGSAAFVNNSTVALTLGTASSTFSAGSISLGGASAITVAVPTLNLAAGGRISVDASSGASNTISGNVSFQTGTGAGTIINNDPVTTHTLTVGAATTNFVQATTLTLDGVGNILVNGQNFALTRLIKTGTGTATVKKNTSITTIQLDNGILTGSDGNSFSNKTLVLNGGTLQMTGTNPTQSQYTSVAVNGNMTLQYTPNSGQWQFGVTTGAGLLSSTNNPTLTIKTGGTSGVITSYLNMTAGFAGTISVDTNSVFRLNNGANLGGTGANILLGTGARMEINTTPGQDGSGNIKNTDLGSLTSTDINANLRGANAGAKGSAGTQYVIGAAGTSTTFAGKILEGGAGGSAQSSGAPAIGDQGITSIKKTGAGTLTLTGTTSTYKAGTIISGGTLAVAGDGSLGAAYTGGLVSWAYSASTSITGTPTIALTGGGGSGALLTANTGSNPFLQVTTAGSGYISDPTVTITGLSADPKPRVRVQGLVTLDGGTLQTNAAMSSNRPVYLTANNGSINTNGVDSTFSGIFNGPGGWTKSGAGTLTLSGASIYSGPTTVNSGTLKVAGSYAAATPGTDNASVLPAGALNVAGTATFKSLASAGSDVALSGSLTLNGSSSAKSIRGGGTLALTAGTLTLSTATAPISAANDVNALNLSGGSQLDLKNNALIIHSSDTTSASRDSRWAQVVTGQNNFDNNGQVTWDGNGIVSSTARTSNMGLGVDVYVVGVASNHDLAKLSADGGAVLPYDNTNPWLGTVSSVGADDILIRMTYAGDTNLDGTVTIDDYNNIDGTFTGLLATNYGWVSGDFDFNGVITIDDYNAIDTGFLYQGGQLTQGMIAQRTAMFGADYVAHLEAVAAAFASVPEPTTIGMLAVGAMGLLSRRRRKA